MLPFFKKTSEKALSTLRQRNLKTQLYSTIRTTVHTNPKTELSENVLEAEELENQLRLYVLVWTENFLRPELFENDDVTTIV